MMSSDRNSWSSSLDLPDAQYVPSCNWLSDTLGLRLEVRDHLLVIDGGVHDDHLWGLRIGFTWRS